MGEQNLVFNIIIIMSPGLLLLLLLLCCISYQIEKLQLENMIQFTHEVYQNCASFMFNSKQFCALLKEYNNNNNDISLCFK